MRALLTLIMFVISCDEIRAIPPAPLGPPEAQEARPREEIIKELKLLRAEMMTNSRSIKGMRDQERARLLNDMISGLVSELIDTFTPPPSTPRLDLDREIREKRLHALDHESRELISSFRRLGLWTLEDNFVMDKEHRSRSEQRAFWLDP